MARALVLIVVFVALLSGAAMNAEFRAIMALAGVVGTCMGLDWLTKQHPKT